MPALSVAPCRLRTCAFALILAIAPASGSAQTRADVGDAMQKLAAALAGEGGGTRAGVDRAFERLVQALSLWDARIAAFERSSRSDMARATPHDAAQIRTTLGATYFERGRLAEALAEFSEATRQDPALPTAWLMRALTLDTMGKPGPARESFDAGLAVKPDDAVMAYYLGRLTLPDSDPVSLPPVIGVLLNTAERLRSSNESGRAPFVDVAIIDDRSPTRFRFLPAGYGIVVVPLLASRKYDAACAALRALIERDPLRNDPALSSEVFAGAALDIDQGRPDAALLRLTAAGDRLIGSSEFHRLRAVAYRRTSQPVAAIQELETAVRIAPGNERAAVALLDTLLEQGELARAERVAVQAQATLSDSAAVSWTQAQIYSALGRDQDVVDAIERALHAEPLAGAGAMWSTLGLFRMRRFDESATAAFEHDVRLNPNRPEARLLLGESLRSEGRINAAFAEFAAAALIQPDSVRAHLSIGEMHLDAARYPEAVAGLRWVVARQPDNDGARHALASALLRSGRQEEAAVELDAFTRLRAQADRADRNERRIGALQLQAALLEQTGSCGQAIDVRKRLIELEPDVATHHVELAACLIRLGRYEPAVASIERAVALGASPVVFRWLADVYAELGRRADSDEAARQYEVRHQEWLRTQRLVR